MEDNDDVVWHDPTRYNFLEHGPELLPGQRPVGLPKTGSTLLEVPASPAEQLEVLLAFLRGSALVHQTHHWQTQGKSFYGDHLLFERVYNESLPLIDSVAERLVGTFGVQKVSARNQALLTHLFVEAVFNFPPGEGTALSEAMVNYSLGAENRVLQQLKVSIACLEETSKLSPGMSNLLEGVGDKHEEFVYLLQQRRGQDYSEYDRR